MGLDVSASRMFLIGIDGGLAHRPGAPAGVLAYGHSEERESGREGSREECCDDLRIDAWAMRPAYSGG